MKILSGLAFALLGICTHTLADPDTPLPAAGAQQEAPGWNVRVEVLMVAVPQDQCLALLPDLRDPKKIDAALTQLLAAVGRKEAILTGYPVVQTGNGQRGVAESILEKRYPTEFTPPEPTTAAPSTDAPPATPDKAHRNVPEGGNPSPMPSAFETRNMGVTLEVEPNVLKNGDFINVNIAVQRVDLLENEYFDAGTTPKGVRLQVAQPQFLTTKDNISTVVKNGEHLLLGVHPLVKPAGYIELFILQAVATQIK